MITEKQQFKAAKELLSRFQGRVTGEDYGMFIAWANVYFHPKHQHLNTKIKRTEMYQDYFRFAYYTLTAQKFKKALKTYCTYKGYVFNPNTPIKNVKTKEIINNNGGFIKQGGHEYFVIQKP